MKYIKRKAQDCLNKIKELGGKIDVVVISGEIAVDRSTMLIANIKRTNLNIHILAIGDENTDKTRILDYGADEFTLKPISPENVADKVFMLLAREAVADNR